MTYNASNDLYEMGRKIRTDRLIHAQKRQAMAFRRMNEAREKGQYDEVIIWGGIQSFCSSDVLVGLGLRPHHQLYS